MNTISPLLSSVTAALISSLWQSVVLVAVVVLFLRTVPNTTARLRFTVWAVAFAVLAALPIYNMSLIARVTAAAPSSSTPLKLDPRWSYAFAAIWLAAVVVRSGHLALQAIRLRSLWKSADPMNVLVVPHLELEAQNLTGRSGRFFRLFPHVHRKAQLCTSTEVDRPSVIGFFAPRVLVPVWLYPRLTAAELHQIVLHELEHLRRRDDWVNLLQKICLVLFPLNPALFWIDRRLATERELACDDGVLSRTHAPRAYATCLTSLAERRLEHRRRDRLTVLALGAGGTARRSELGRRIESILVFGRRSILSPAPARALTALLIAGVLGGAATLVHCPQLVAFTSATHAQPDASLMPSARPVPAHQLQSSRFEDVVFHPKPTAGNPVLSCPARPRVKYKPRPVANVAQVDTVYSEAAPQPDRHWMLLTSWQQRAPQPVLVALPDGRTFLATYTAGPDQAGWFLIQL